MKDISTKCQQVLSVVKSTILNNLAPSTYYLVLIKAFMPFKVFQVDLKIYNIRLEGFEILNKSLILCCTFHFIGPHTSEIGYGKF